MPESRFARLTSGASTPRTVAEQLPRQDSAISTCLPGRKGPLACTFSHLRPRAERARIRGVALLANGWARWRKWHRAGRSATLRRRLPGLVGSGDQATDHHDYPGLPGAHPGDDLPVIAGQMHTGRGTCIFQQALAGSIHDPSGLSITTLAVSIAWRCVSKGPRSQRPPAGVGPDGQIRLVHRPDLHGLIIY